MKRFFQLLDMIVVGCIIAVTIGFIMMISTDTMVFKMIGFFMSIVFVIFGFIYTYRKLFTENDVIYQLKAADKGNVFTKEIDEIKKYCESLELHKSQFVNYTGNVDNMKESYQIIYDKIYSDIKYSIDYIRHYDYISMADKGPVKNRVNEMRLLIHKLNELDALYVELDNSMNEVDTQRVDDLLQALKEII